MGRIATTAMLVPSGTTYPAMTFIDEHLVGRVKKIDARLFWNEKKS
jgi:hypothetical protein